MLSVLSKNSFSGSIPESLGRLNLLGYLDISNNQLTGPLQVHGLRNLEYINLARNSLSGSIPESLGQLINLNFLDLSNNQLTGPFPAWFHDLTNLRILNLGQNIFSGDIPIRIGRGLIDGGVPLTSIREFIRLLTTRDASFSYQDRFDKLKLKGIKRFFRKYYFYVRNTKDLLWVRGTSRWEMLYSFNFDDLLLQKVMDEYIKGEETRLLTKAYETMLKDPEPFAEKLDLLNLNKIWQNFQKTEPVHVIQNLHLLQHAQK
jgi:hypothetical protein